MPNKVYVINKHGRPLMPCSPAKARHLLDEGKAKVKKRTPFTSCFLAAPAIRRRSSSAWMPAAKQSDFRLLPKRKNYSPQK